MENFLPKWLVSGLGGLLIIFVAMLIVQQGYNFNQQIKNQKPANTITVSGDAQVTATPDLATVSVGVQTSGADAQTVKDQNNTKVNAVIDFVKKQGVDQKDITTSNLNEYPQQNQIYPMIVSPGMPTPVRPSGGTSYVANQTITVKVHGVDKSTDVLSKITGGAVDAGANEVDGVSFSFEDTTLKNLQQQARQQAIDDAKQKAQGLADKAGLSLGKVTSISESANGYPGPMPYALNSVAMGGAGKAVAPDIQNGTQDISESMSVTFEVK